ncbi:MAG: OmpA family protein [Spirochaetia bacterium]|nr:OmpA family protein [Spirochaetia bacterium]
MRLTGLVFVLLGFAVHCAAFQRKPAAQAGSQNRTLAQTGETAEGIPADSALTEPVARDESKLKVMRERILLFQPRTEITEATHDQFLEFQDRVLTQEQIVFLTKIAESAPEPLGRRLLAIEALAGSEIKKGNLKGAQEIWSKAKVPGLEKYSATVVAILASGKGDSKLINLKGNINTDLAEYDAVQELSGKRIYFTRYDQNLRLSDPPGEDIYLAEKQTDGSWKAKPMTELNTKSHESVLGVSADGGSLFLFGNYPGSLGSGDIFESKLTANGWSRPAPLPKPINSPHFDSDASFSPDGRSVIFVSDRAGGYYPYHARQKEFFAGGKNGNTDLYVSFRNADGSFSLPRNLGPIVNTPGSERNPYLHADGKTLYFSSEGHPGLGGHDVFRTVRLDDTWTNWSEPVNLGPAVNGPGDDSGFRITAHGDSGIISGSLIETKGPSDIFMVAPLPVQAKPQDEVAILRGNVKSANGAPVEANIKWNSKGKEEGQSRSRPDTGEYLIPLAVNRQYQIEIEKEGFFKQTFPVDTTAAKLKAKEVEIPVAMKADPDYKPPKSEPVKEVANVELAKTPQKDGPAKEQREMRPLLLPDIRTQDQPALKPDIKPDPKKPQATPQKPETKPVKPETEPGSGAMKTRVVYFSSNSLRMMNPGILKLVAKNLKANPKSRVMIEAHTDSMGTGKYNRNLSELRARQVYLYLTRLGIPGSRIGYRGIGEKRPASNNSTAKGRKLNRRAVVTIISG